MSVEDQPDRAPSRWSAPRVTVRLALFLIVAAPLLIPSPIDNELDVVAGARHFGDPGWIAQDWYLGRAIEYRYLFDALFSGLLHLSLSTSAAIVVGRLVSAALFTFAIAELLDLLACPWHLGLVATCLYLRYPSLGAREWIVAGLETKVFAYALALLGLVSFARRRLSAASFQLGLAISFHILVGVYGLFCVVFAGLLDRDLRGELRRSLSRAPLLLLGASFGLYTLFARVRDGRGVSADVLGRAAEIYVRYRLPHHLLPSEWPSHWLVAAIASTALFAAIASRAAGPRKLAATYALGAMLLFFAGLLLFALGQIELLKFYWFRFGDTIAPLFTCLLCASYLPDLSSKLAPPAARFASIAAAVLALFIVGRRTVRFAAGPASLRGLRDETFFAHDTEPPLREALRWVRGNTPADSRFLAPPSTDAFYFLAERPVFVMFKFSPQSERDIVEWYRRITAANGGQAPRISGFASEPELAAGYLRLSRAQLEALAGAEHLDYFLTPARADLAGWAPVYANAAYAIYRLPKID